MGLKTEEQPYTQKCEEQKKKYLRLGIVSIVNLGTVIPVLWFLGLWILDFLGGQEIPVLLQRSRLHLLIVNLYLVGLVWVEDQRVQVCKFIILQEGEREMGQNVSSGNMATRVRSFSLKFQ